MVANANEQVQSDNNMNMDMCQIYATSIVGRIFFVSFILRRMLDLVARGEKIILVAHGLFSSFYFCLLISNPFVCFFQMKIKRETQYWS